MISTHHDNIYVLNNNLLLIYNLDLNLTRTQKVMAVYTPILHKNYVAVYKTLYKISNGDLVAVRIFRKKIIGLQTDEEYIVVSESTGNVLIARRAEHRFQPLLGHYIQLNKLLIHDSAVITADNYKIRVSEYDGRIRNIFFVDNQNVFYNGGYFYVVYENNLLVYDKKERMDGEKCEIGCDTLVLLNKITIDNEVRDVLLLEGAVYLITDKNNYLVRDSACRLGAPSPYNFKDAIIDDDSVYFYTEESKLQKINVKDLK